MLRVAVLPAVSGRLSLRRLCFRLYWSCMRHLRRPPSLAVTAGLLSPVRAISGRSGAMARGLGM